MLNVTDKARQLLKETLTARSDDPEVSLRLSVKQSGQFEIMQDREVQGDQVVEHEGVKVLLVAPELATIVEGVTLDVQDTPNGPQLTVLRNK